MLRRSLSLLAALLSTSCLLEDPYFINESEPLAADDTDDDSPNETTTANEKPEAEPEDPPEPAIQPERPPPVPGEPDDILVDPDVTPAEPAPDDDDAPEPSPVVEPSPEPANVVEPVPEPSVAEQPTSEPSVEVDAGMPEPVDVPEPAPEPVVDAGPEPCEPGTPGCVPLSGCGNGNVEQQEDCDDADFGAESCYSLGFSGGSLACSASCEFDTSECLSGPSCEAATSGATGLVYEGNLNGQGNDVRYYSCSTGGRDTQDVTLSWTAPSTGCFEISVDSPQEIDTIIGVFEDCSIDTELACDNEHGPADPDSILQFEATANTTYALAIDAFEPGDQATIEVTIVHCVSGDWTCDATNYGDGLCDCGCGTFDPDCTDETVTSCDTCGDDGACGSTECQGVDEQQNWTCNSNGGPFGR